MFVVFREEWDWIQTLSAAGEKECSGEESEEPRAESHAPLLFYELQTAIKSLLKHINLPLHQVHTLSHSQVSAGFTDAMNLYLSPGNFEMGLVLAQNLSWFVFLNGNCVISLECNKNIKLLFKCCI